MNNEPFKIHCKECNASTLVDVESFDPYYCESCLASLDFFLGPMAGRPSSYPDVRIGPPVEDLIAKIKDCMKILEDKYISPIVNENEFKLTLNKYQRDNLLWALLTIMQDPAYNDLNTGDWVGEIPWLLRRPDQQEKYPTLDEKDSPNKPFVIKPKAETHEEKMAKVLKTIANTQELNRKICEMGACIHTDEAHSKYAFDNDEYDGE